MERLSTITRDTKETQISVNIDIDGEGRADIDTGIGFFDHMLKSFTKHGLFNLVCKVSGDLEVDGHHTVEDTGIVLGNAIKQALGDKQGIKRFGSFLLPMDDALVLCSLDLGGRPYFNFDFKFPTERVGDMDTQLFREFFQAVANGAGMNLHFMILSGENSHHIAEAMYKAFAKALDEATTIDPRIEGVQSTKGML